MDRCAGRRLCRRCASTSVFLRSASRGWQLHGGRHRVGYDGSHEATNSGGRRGGGLLWPFGSEKPGNTSRGHLWPTEASSQSWKPALLPLCFPCRRGGRKAAPIGLQGTEAEHRSRKQKHLQEKVSTVYPTSSIGCGESKLLVKVAVRSQSRGVFDWMFRSLEPTAERRSCKRTRTGSALFPKAFRRREAVRRRCSTMWKFSVPVCRSLEKRTSMRW